MSKDKDKDKDAKDGEEADVPKPSKLPMLLSLVNILVTGAVGFLVFSSAGPQPVEKEVIDPSIPPVAVPLDPFVVNLNEPKSSRYLKATIEVEVHGEERVALIETKKRAIRADLLRYLSGLKVDDTTGEEKKLKIRDELIARVEKQTGANTLAGLYLTEFVIQ
jgi:flagellar FliL protein